MSTLFRRKPTYCTAMPVVSETGNEYVVQFCDAGGKPTASHYEFLAKEDFERQFEAYRRRNRNSKKKTIQKEKKDA